MLKKQYIVSLLVVLLSLSFVSVVMAGENDYNNILGTDQFSFEDSQRVTDIEVAAMNHDYDQDRLALVGTEAGAWEYDANAEQTEAELAAKEHNYNQNRLLDVGTEAGNWRYRFDSSENAICGTC